jgi:hypothetical protein
MSRLLDETDPVAVLNEIGRLALLIPQEAIQRYAKAGGMRLHAMRLRPEASMIRIFLCWMGFHRWYRYEARPPEGTWVTAYCRRPCCRFRRRC